MMGNHADHVAVIFALMSMRAVWVPVNPRLRGRPLEFQIEAADPHLCLADGELAAGARGAGPAGGFRSGRRACRTARNRPALARAVIPAKRRRLTMS